MKLLPRILLASLTGFLAGRTVSGVWLQPMAAPKTPPVAHSGLSGPALPPGSGREEEWRLWLQSRAPLSPVNTAEEFWKRMPVSRKVTEEEWQLTLDEAFLTLPDAEFLKILQDRRFADFPPLYEVEQKAGWSRKLLGLGLEQALAMAGKMPTKWLNLHLDDLLMRELVKKDPDRGLKWVQASGKNSWETRDFILTVAKNDPDKAQALISQVTPESTRKVCANGLLTGLAEKDWRAAVEFGRANFTEEEWAKEATQMFDGIYGGRLKGLLETAPEITDPAARSCAYSRSLSALSRTGGEMLGKVLELPPGTLNSASWEEIGTGCLWRTEDSTKDPAGIAARLKELAEKVPAANRADFWEGIWGSACMNYPTVAAQFYDLLTLRQVENLASTWVEKDPAGASAWLAKLEPSERREAAVAKFAGDAAAVDPAGAAAWAAELRDPAVRAEKLRNALSAWSQQDSGQARSWAEANGAAGLLESK